MKRMRLTVTAVTALVALLVASVALAASYNTYSATVKVSQHGAGTAKKPVALGMVQRLSAKPANGTPNADPLTDIKLTMPKVTAHQAGFPVCTAAKINAAQTDAGCPKGALVGRGPVTAELWSPKAPTVAGNPCDPVLDIWNGGPGKLTYFFTIPAGHSCVGLQTGAVAAWTGTLREHGTTLVDDTPLPPPVSTNAGNIGLYSALESETLTFRKLTHKVGAKTVAFFASTGCVAGKRPYSVAFTATNGHTPQTVTVTGKTGC
ncbi:MAG TPA: hypothetical protein VFN48_10645 [Solirubrobacteraceae bacterium]|nr:hypothetical protein [Solirubrobacteraceae bacterium]